MLNTMNNHCDIPCYYFIAIDPGNVIAFSRRLVGLFKSAFAVRKTDEHGRPT